ncbi:MAG TPA: APC family permease [Thermoleophilaceae bacterium]|jgi:APA family basic amino acid/polyamine antiporter|nr:APC family permease [Thermoleophilaceae bacterium]
MAGLSELRARVRAPLAVRKLLPGPLALGGRGMGALGLFAIGLTAVGASIYFSLGVVAGNALGLTPLAYLLAGVFFVLTMMTYVEGGVLHQERGGASSLARYAFNELWSFIAGWAILLDYLIVLAISAFSISHYLTVLWPNADARVPAFAIAGLVIAATAVLNIRGLPVDRLRLVLAIGLINLVTLFAVLAVGLSLFSDPKVVTDSIHLGSAPQWDDLIFGLVVATVALTGIEAASGFAGDVQAATVELRRLVVIGTLVVLVVFVGVSALAVMAVPVHGNATALGSTYVEAPVLGIVDQFSPKGVENAFRWIVAIVASLALFQAANTSMLGLSRLSYSLATNGQIPAGLGKLHRDHATPYMAIMIASVLAFALVLSNDIEFLVGIFAFGAMLAFTLAHVSIVVLRFREPSLPRAFRIPFNVRVGGAPVPLPAVAGALIAGAAWISVIILHSGARVLGGLWMIAGIAFYVTYRKIQGKPLAKRYQIPAEALREAPEVEYGAILVPIFGEGMDDDIVGTAGRLAAEEAEEGEGGAVIEAIYVVEIPMSLPLDARVPEEKIQEARRALQRAKHVGEEYEGVEVATASVRARTYGQGIVEEARRRGVEAIVLAAEEPTRMRGGRRMGGRGGPRNRSVGETTRYVIEKAPCRVILTAPPLGEEGTREGVAP